VKKRTWYFIVAILLTVFEVVAVAWCGRLAWLTSRREIWEWLMYVVMVSIGASSLATLWIQALPRLLGACVGWGAIGSPMPAKAREKLDV